MYCPKCRSRLYPDDSKYMEAIGVCGSCAMWNETYKKLWNDYVDKKARR